MADREEQAGTTILDDAVVLDGAVEPDRRTLEVAGGLLVAYTRRSPRKDTENEDTVAVIPWGPQAAVMVVADGAGGLPAGKRASSTAVEALAASLRDSLEQTRLLRTAVLDGIEAANTAVRNLSNGSATTLTVVTIEGRLARTYQVGDSEALLVGQRGLLRLHTTAHSPTGFAVEAGFLDERDALHHEDRHLVSNFIGTPDMTIDVGASAELQARDTIVVASDGVTDNLHLDELIEMTRKGAIDEAVDAVVAAVERRMSTVGPGEPSKPDDMSLIIFRKPAS